MRIFVASLVVLAILYFWGPRLQQRQTAGWPREHEAINRPQYVAVMISAARDPPMDAFWNDVALNQGKPDPMIVPPRKPARALQNRRVTAKKSRHRGER